MVFKENSKIMRIINNIFHSNYLIFSIGIFLLAISFILWNASVNDSLNDLSKNINSIASTYSNNINDRLDKIEFSLDEHASYGAPSSTKEEEQWDTRSEFYIDIYPGIENIAWVNKDIVVQRVSPTESSEYIINTVATTNNQNIFGETIMIVPIYDRVVFEGFILAHIDMLKLILDVDFEDKPDVMIGVFDETTLLASSENWQETNTDISSKRTIIVKDKLYSFVIKPTEEMISLSISNTYIILFFGISLAIIITVIWYFSNASSKRLEGLVNKKTIEFKYLSYHDQLTGLYNRRFFEEDISRLDLSRNYPITLILCDLNGLKIINDSFGHFKGDQALKRTVSVIKDVFDEHSVLYRLGGDEFAIIITQSKENHFLKKMDKIRNDIRKVEIEGIGLSISLGYSTKYDSKKKYDLLFTEAEDMMYREKLSQLPSNRRSTINTIIEALNQKDNLSEVHSKRVALLSEKIARILGWNTNQVGEIKTAGLLHDIGKIAISNDILNSSNKLTNEEYNEIKKHPETGYRILSSVPSMRDVAEIIYCHHERIDGKGYPRGIFNTDIPIQSCVIAIADALDAMLFDRSYRRKLSREEAKQELINYSGTQFKSDIIDVVIKNFDEIVSYSDMSKSNV